MLTPEDRQRIEEEERKRVAEEEYRSRVRANLKSPKPKASDPLRTIAKFGLVAILVMVGWGTLKKSGSGASVLRPFSRPLMPSRVQAGPLRTTYWQFEVSETATNAHVVGSFHAEGGLGDDIEVVVAEWGQCENWMKNHPAQLLYKSGKTTNGTLDVPVRRGGTYCLAFNNGMSLLSTKVVMGDISLRYLIP